MLCLQVVETTSGVRGVPADEEQARQWLRSYSDVSINTVTGVVATNTESGQQSAGVDTVRITWGTIRFVLLQVSSLSLCSSCNSVQQRVAACCTASVECGALLDQAVPTNWVTLSS
jgi:predicted house-cleaning NTP pyrophosphatase (Maf/HAM1 superfamily)